MIIIFVVEVVLFQESEFAICDTAVAQLVAVVLELRDLKQEMLEDIRGKDTAGGGGFMTPITMWQVKKCFRGGLIFVLYSRVALTNTK